jgi:antitoxin (DNA-binding transcriptional repressor) of toxin-antitoxin stability system
VTATLEQLRHDWQRLIIIAQGGEEIMIVCEGKVVAKLTGVSKTISTMDRQAWLNNLSKLRRSVSLNQTVPSTESILNDLRSDRN